MGQNLSERRTDGQPKTVLRDQMRANVPLVLIRQISSCESF